MPDAIVIHLDGFGKTADAAQLDVDDAAAAQFVGLARIFDMPDGFVQTDWRFDFSIIKEPIEDKCFEDNPLACSYCFFRRNSTIFLCSIIVRSTI